MATEQEREEQRHFEAEEAVRIVRDAEPHKTERMNRLLRDNPDLDSVLGDVEPINSARLPKQRKRRTRDLPKDHIRRLAFRVLALLSGLPAKNRERVLRMAARLNMAG